MQHEATIDLLMTCQKEDYQVSVDHQQLKLSKVKPCVRGGLLCRRSLTYNGSTDSGEKQYTFSRNRTLTFDLLPGCDVGGILSGDAGQQAAAPGQLRDHQGQPPTHSLKTILSPHSHPVSAFSTVFSELCEMLHTLLQNKLCVR